MSEFNDVPIRHSILDADFIEAEKYLRSRMSDMVNLTAAEMLRGSPMASGGITYTALATEYSASELTLDSIREAVAKIPELPAFPPVAIKEADLGEVVRERGEGYFWDIGLRVVRSELLPPDTVIVIGGKEYAEFVRRASKTGAKIDALIALTLWIDSLPAETFEPKFIKPPTRDYFAIDQILWKTQFQFKIHYPETIRGVTMAGCVRMASQIAFGTWAVTCAEKFLLVKFAEEIVRGGDE